MTFKKNGGIIIKKEDSVMIAYHEEKHTNMFEYTQNIIDTVRESLLVLDAQMKVVSANRSFYNTFKVNIDNTEGQSLLELGNNQWNIPQLIELLNKVIYQNFVFCDFLVEHNFLDIGKKIMNLNARQIKQKEDKLTIILLAIEDITDKIHAERLLKKKNKALEKALSEIKTLKGIVPICSFCKKIRNDKGYWEQVEVYVRNHSQADFSHSICPECYKKNYPGL